MKININDLSVVAVAKIIQEYCPWCGSKMKDWFKEGE